MNLAAVAAHRPAAVVLTGPPGRRSPRRAGDIVAGFAPPLVGPAFVVASCASLQAAAALATTVFAAFGPAGTGALRFAAAAVVLLALARPRLRGRPARSWSTIAAFGAAMAALNFCLYEAIARIPLGTAVTLQFLGPLAVALLGGRRKLDVAFAVAAGAGVALLTGSLSGASLAGAALALGAAAITAGSLLLATRVADESAGLDGLALAVGVAAILTLPVSVPAALGAPRLGDLRIAAAVGVLGIAVPYALELSALRRLPVRTLGVLLSLDPAVAGLAGLLLLGQQLSLAELLGIALVIAASCGAVSGRPTSGDQDSWGAA
jgi:inner membrane transporter RhtA